jgi:hypothetical protein
MHVYKNDLLCKYLKLGKDIGFDAAQNLFCKLNSVYRCARCRSDAISAMAIVMNDLRWIKKKKI